MKAWSVPALVAMFLLFGGAASAQSYSIRVTHNTNLRASYSLDSAIIASAPAGATLQVVGNNNRWLRVKWNGKDAWMADWVAYSRVEASEQTPAQPTDNVDNCCFVDRQCHSEQDWTAGYYAFRDYQCSAPAQTPASSAPAGGFPAQIDNCCFVDRQCHSDQDWAAGYYAFLNNQCGAPGQSVRSVDQADVKRRVLRIEGSARYIAAVNAALDLFKARAPHWYVYTVFGHDWSLELPEGTIVSPPPHVKLHLYSTAGSHLLEDICWFASHLVHYAAHNYQDERNMASGGSRAKLLSLEDEREALTLQIEALEATCPGHGTLPWWREILANIDNPEYQWWHG